MSLPVDGIWGWGDGRVLCGANHPNHRKICGKTAVYITVKNFEIDLKLCRHAYLVVAIICINFCEFQDVEKNNTAIYGRCIPMASLASL